MSGSAAIRNTAVDPFFFGAAACRLEWRSRAAAVSGLAILTQLDAELSGHS